MIDTTNIEMDPVHEDLIIETDQFNNIINPLFNNFNSKLLRLSTQNVQGLNDLTK
jgi:hypothetical protein